MQHGMEGVLGDRASVCARRSAFGYVAGVLIGAKAVFQVPSMA